MKTSKPLRYAVTCFLVLLIAIPPPLFAQQGKTDAKAPSKGFSQAELDQLLAPVALYPDSLLAQIFIAATYPLEVVMAERWARENKTLPADQWNAALNRQPWDPSVKALVPFPDVLEMMSQKLEWTQKVGDAFLAQQADVMDTVQRLRKRAHDAGSLKSTEQQNVIVEREVIRVEPANPSVVYVPVYDPWWVYGPWWWPAYPPYVVYPYPAGVAIAPGFVWFGVGLFVGAYWGSWGYWGWHNHTCYVNVNRNAYYRHGGHGGTGSGAVGGAWASQHATQAWQHDPSHRRGVAYRDTATGERFGQTNRAAVESRRGFRGYEGNWMERGAGRTAGIGSAAMSARGASRPDRSGRSDTLSARTGRTDAAIGRTGRPDAAVRSHAMSSRTGRPDRAAVERSLAGRAFEGIGRGHEVRRQSSWGRDSLRAAIPGGAAAGNAVRSTQPRGGSVGEAVRGFPQGARGGDAVRSFPQGAARGGDAVRGFPRGVGGSGIGGGGFRGGPR